MTDCGNFVSEFFMSTDRCIWYNNKCREKEDHPFYATSSQEGEQQQQEDVIYPIKGNS